MKLLQVLCLGVTSLVMMAHAALLSMPTIDADDDETGVATPIAAPFPQLQQPPSSSPSQPPSPSKAGENSKLIESFSNEGPNTVDQAEEKIGTHGNWVKKKDFLMRSFDVQKEIEALATTIQSYRGIYQQKFNAIDQELDTFYKQLGLEQSKVQELFTKLEEYIEQKRQRRIARFKRDITEAREQQLAIEQLEESLKINKEELAQLKNDMKSIEDLDKSVNARIQRADEQITMAQREAARSKDIVQSMWDMLDDKRAKAAYFELKDGILRRLQASDSYLQQELLGDLEKVAGTISGQIKKAREAVKNLEEKGFIIRDRTKRLDEHAAKKAKEAAEQEQNQTASKSRPKLQESRGFFGRIYDGIVNFIVSIYKFFTGLFGAKESVIKARIRQRTPAEIAAAQAALQAQPSPPGSSNTAPAAPTIGGQQPPAGSTMPQQPPMPAPLPIATNQVPAPQQFTPAMSAGMPVIPVGQ